MPNQPDITSDDLQAENLQTQRRNRVIGLIFLFFSLLFLGCTFAINKVIINEGVDPILMAFIRMSFACAFMFPFYLFEKQRLAWSFAEWRLVIFVGIVALTLAQIFEYSGTALTKASNISIIVSNESIVAMILSAVLLKEQLRRSTIIGAAIAVTGLYMIMQDDLMVAEWHWDSSLMGDFLGVLAVLCWSLYTVYSKKLTGTCGPMTALFYVSIMSCIAFAFITYFLGLWSELTTLTKKAWVLSIFLGIVGSGLGHIFYYWALNRLPANIVSVSLTMLPVFGVGWSMLLLNEQLSHLELAGGIVIIMGVAYAVWPRPRVRNTLKVEINAFES